MKTTPLLTIALLAGLGAACVTTRTYEAKVAELGVSQRDSAALEKRLRADLTAARAQIAELERRLGRAEERQKETADDNAQLKLHLDENAALIAEMKKRLARLGQDVDKLAGQRGDMTAALASTNARLEELRRQTAAAEARAELFRTLVGRLTAMIDARKLEVVFRKGRMLIVLPSDVLFESGRTLIKSDAEAALKAVAVAIADIKDRTFLVIGHTDTVPIHTSRFPSNWELSTARAIAVAHVLMDNGLPASALGVAGHGEHDPVAPNDFDENRALNRRIEIALEPNLSELPTLDAAGAVSRQ